MGQRNKGFYDLTALAEQADGWATKWERQKDRAAVGAARYLRTIASIARLMAEAIERGDYEGVLVQVYQQERIRFDE